MVKVTFKYCDKYTHGGWNTQSGIYKSVQDCIQWNGLGKDCEYAIVSVEHVDEKKRED